MNIVRDIQTVLEAAGAAEYLRSAVGKSGRILSLLAEPEIQDLIRAVQRVRIALVRRALADKLITAAEARPVADGGLETIDLVKRLLNAPQQPIQQEGEGPVEVRVEPPSP